MDRSRAVLLACFAVLSAQPGMVRADAPSTPPARADVSSRAFDLDPWIREWCPTDPADLTSIPVSPVEPAAPTQGVSHPAVPLPPALAGAAALGAGWVLRRTWRGVHRHLRNRR